MPQSRWKQSENQLAMMRAAGQITNNDWPVICPLCQNGSIRFYVHEWKTISKGRATLWVWCPSCYQWEHISRLKVTLGKYNDPLLETEPNFGKMNPDWFDRLDLLWETNRLPHSFPTA